MFKQTGEQRIPAEDMVEVLELQIPDLFAGLQNGA